MFSASGSYAISSDPFFRQRVASAMVSNALNVQSEDPNALAVPLGYFPGNLALHQKRSVLAFNTLNNPSGYVGLFALAVSTDPTNVGIGSGTPPGQGTDSQLLTAISSVWNALAIQGQ